MRVLVRLILLAGVAAAVALVIRDSVATRVARALEEPVSEVLALIPVVRHAAPPPVQPAVVAPARVAAAPVVITPRTIKPAAKKPSTPAVHLVTRKDVESAMETRLSGLRAVLVRDDAGKPLGLRLNGVSRLASFGVQDGDVLVSANGYPLRTADECATAVGALKDFKRVTFVLRRGDSGYAVTLELADAGLYRREIH